MLCSIFSYHGGNTFPHFCNLWSVYATKQDVSVVAVTCVKSAFVKTLTREAFRSQEKLADFLNLNTYETWLWE